MTEGLSGFPTTILLVVVVVVVHGMVSVKTIAVIGCIVALVMIAGCSDPNVEDKTPEPVPGERIGDNIGDGGGTYRYVDNQTGVTCYVAQNGGGDPSIDCVEVTPHE